MHLSSLRLVRLTVFAAACVSAAARAQSGEPPAGGPPGDHPQVSAEMKAAFEACKSQGRPGDTAFDSCMSSKGFKRPDGAPKPPGS